LFKVIFIVSEIKRKLHSSKFWGFVGNLLCYYQANRSFSLHDLAREKKSNLLVYLVILIYLLITVLPVSCIYHLHAVLRQYLVS